MPEEKTNQTENQGSASETVSKVTKDYAVPASAVCAEDDVGEISIKEFGEFQVQKQAEAYEHIKVDLIHFTYRPDGKPSDNIRAVFVEEFRTGPDAGNQAKRIENVKLESEDGKVFIGSGEIQGYFKAEGVFTMSAKLTAASKELLPGTLMVYFECTEAE